MIAYQSGYAPVYTRRLSPVRLSQAAPGSTPAPEAAAPTKLTPALIRTAITGGLVIETALGAAGTWVGLYTGGHASGLLKVLGYTVGAVSAVSGVVSLAELVIYLVKGLPISEVPVGPAVQQSAVPISK
jgi:hypothetical protein